MINDKLRVMKHPSSVPKSSFYHSFASAVIIPHHLNPCLPAGRILISGLIIHISGSAATDEQSVRAMPGLFLNQRLKAQQKLRGLIK